MQELVGILSEHGGKMLFSDWVAEGRARGLRVDLIQNLKRLGLVHTELDDEGQHWIVAGSKNVEVSNG